MHVYRDRDADLYLLAGQRIAVIGYGNQGRSQALNLRDSGLEVIVGNRQDAYAERARQDGFSPLPIAQAAMEGQVILLLIPDEVMPAVFEAEIAPHLAAGKALVFASGYNIAFGALDPPPFVDVVLVAPRMIGAGVRDLYLDGRGFPSFIGVAQDHSGRAKATALALAKGIGSTRSGAVEVTFAQEAELDLFTEQCFGPAFGHVLTSAVDLLLEQGYPPEAVLLELYMSGELAYTMGKIAELGMVEQTALHSSTSQYGSMSRGMRFMLPELRTRMRQGLDEIRSGRFAEEWAAEQAAGCPTLDMLREAAGSLPLYQLECELRQTMGTSAPVPQRDTRPLLPATPAGGGFLAQGRSWLRALRARLGRRPQVQTATEPLTPEQMAATLRAFIARAVQDQALRAFANDNRLTTHYVLDGQIEFHLCFQEGSVTGAMGPPPTPAEVCIEAEARVLDGMLTGEINALRAAMTGQLVFSGDAALAVRVQRIQADLRRLYTAARKQTTGR